MLQCPCEVPSHWSFLGAYPCMGFCKPSTCSCGCGYRLWQVWVQVTLKNPRVSHDIPYSGVLSVITVFNLDPIIQLYLFKLVHPNTSPQSHSNPWTVYIITPPVAYIESFKLSIQIAHAWISFHTQDVECLIKAHEVTMHVQQAPQHPGVCSFITPPS